MLMSGQMPAHQTLTTQALYQGYTYLRAHRNGKIEANAFFRAAFSAAPFLSIENLDDFTNIFQSTIYNYFAENYGTTSERKTDEKELDAMSVKELKKKLSGLKKF